MEKRCVGEGYLKSAEKSLSQQMKQPQIGLLNWKIGQPYTIIPSLPIPRPISFGQN